MNLIPKCEFVLCLFPAGCGQLLIYQQCLSVCPQLRRNPSSSSEDSPKAFHMSAREYVESLHQNSKTTLLYGKNNVQVQPVRPTDQLSLDCAVYNASILYC